MKYVNDIHSEYNIDNETDKQMQINTKIVQQNNADILLESNMTYIGNTTNDTNNIDNTNKNDDQFL